MNWDIEVNRSNIYSVIPLLEKKKEFEEVKVKSKLPIRVFNNTIRLWGYKNKIGLRITGVPDGVFIFKKGDYERYQKGGPRPVHPDVAKKREEIYDQYASDGSSLQFIGNKYGITRERIRQIVKAHEQHNAIDHKEVKETRKQKWFVGIAPKDRIEVIDELAKPYVDIVTDKRTCFACDKIMKDEDHRYLGLCSSCKKILKIRVLVSTRIRRYKATGNRHYLHMALVDINRYGIQPEELKGM